MCTFWGGTCDHYSARPDNLESTSNCVRTSSGNVVSIFIKLGQTFKGWNEEILWSKNRSPCVEEDESVGCRRNIWLEKRNHLDRKSYHW